MNNVLKLQEMTSTSGADVQSWSTLSGICRTLAAQAANVQP
ncbi:class III lanthipeptide [Pseudoalteromonas galatheae]|nr:class III lanthipeptide [Pseudoalteromonas galatheae]